MKSLCREPVDKEVRVGRRSGCLGPLEAPDHLRGEGDDALAGGDGGPGRPGPLGRGMAATRGSAGLHPH